ncbi:hypothetical protein BRC64_00065 [Halobacteriales archaeon QH_10_67_22]|nr:MAG: hypothetical protein BRC64_00065 [Halobacteriales archaeon QH_10_67_22]
MACRLTLDGPPPGAPDAPLVCGLCGHTVEPGYDFCVSCGIDLPSGAPGEADKPEHTQEKPLEQPRSEDDDADADDQELQLFRRRPDPYLENGWEIERDDGDSVDLSYQDFGSAGIHVALVLFLVTIGWGTCCTPSTARSSGKTARR